jgi:hypothetical protein
MVVCTDLNFFFNSWTHFYFFSIAIKLKKKFLPNQNNTLKPDYFFLYYNKYVKQNIFCGQCCDSLFNFFPF